MITLSSIKSEITTTLSQYDDAGLIDDITLTNWLEDGLKGFGGNVMVEEEQVIKIKNGRGKLPDNFYSLLYAVKCDIEGYKTDCEEDTKHLQSTYFYEERLEETTYFSNDLNEDTCIEGQDCKRVIQNVYWIDREGKNKKAQVGYNNITPLRLTKNYKRQKCDVGCPNIKEKNSEYEISIFNYNYIQTNFNNGYIYIRFRGLPTEDGELYVPTTHRNKLKQNLYYLGLSKSLEAILFNSDDPNIATKYKLAESKERETYQEALSETFVEGLSGWADLIKKRNKQRVSVFQYNTIGI